MEPLYRRVNTRARNVAHRHGGDYRHRRTTEAERTSDETRGPMRGGRRRGLDDTVEPVFWLVARQPHERRPYVRVGESTYYSGLFVDDDNRLRVVDPDLGPETMGRFCSCCTHTFNGVRYG